MCCRGQLQQEGDFGVHTVAPSSISACKAMYSVEGFCYLPGTAQGTWFMSPGCAQVAHRRACSQRWRFAAPAVVSCGHASNLVITLVTLPEVNYKRKKRRWVKMGARGGTVDDCSRLPERDGRDGSSCIRPDSRNFEEVADCGGR